MSHWPIEGISRIPTEKFPYVAPTSNLAANEGKPIGTLRVSCLCLLQHHSFHQGAAEPSFLPLEGAQRATPKHVTLQKDYFELEAMEKQQMQKDAFLEGPLSD